MAKKIQEEVVNKVVVTFSFLRKEHVIFTYENDMFIRESSPHISLIFIQLLRQRLSHTSVKENATMPISIMGSDSFVFFDQG